MGIILKVIIALITAAAVTTCTCTGVSAAVKTTTCPAFNFVCVQK